MLVVNGGDLAANALIYAQPSASTLDYLKSNMQSVMNRIGDYGTNFVNSLQAMYDKFNSSSVINASKLIVNQIGTSLAPNTIYRVPIQEFHLASPLMQEYIMVQPDIFSRYERNLCDGYSESYIDPEPNTPLEDRTRYKEVMDGIVQYDTQGNGYVTHYSHDGSSLSYIDQLSILETWENAYKLLIEGKDPTSVNYEEF